MVRIVLYVSVVIALAIQISSCTFYNEEDYFPIDTCNVENITYSSLTYIFTGICAACHSESFTYRENIKMDSYENVVSSISTGPVWKAINHEEGVRAMPNGLPKLSDCEISKIGAWINAGMPEN